MKKIRDVIVKIADKEILGKIIIKQDNSFEGAVDDETVDYLVFGFITENYIEMFKTIDRYPILYKGQKEGNIYRGHRVIPTDENDEAESDCTIGVYDPELYRNVNQQGEIIGLERHIQKIKKASMPKINNN